MDREQLEEEVYKRLKITRAVDDPIIRDAIKAKPTANLEDILERMKEVGR